MITKKKFLFLILCIVILIKTTVLTAQFNNRSIQVQISNVNTSSYDRIKKHAEYCTAITYPVSKLISIRLAINYFQDKYYWNKRNFEYQGTTYNSRNGQLWREHSYIASLMFNLFKNIYSGVGIGIDNIYVKRITFPGWISYYVDSNDNVKLGYRKEYKKTNNCLSSCLFLGWQQPLWRNIILMIEGKFRFIKTSRQITDTNDSKINMYNLSGGIAINF